MKCQNSNETFISGIFNMFFIPKFRIYAKTKDFYLLFWPDLYALDKDRRIINLSLVSDKVY